MERYGLPYKGSKNKLAERIVDLFPKKTNFYDLFCGGCAVTHRALVTGKFKKYVINDIDGGMPRLFADAVAGRYKDEKRWISRDDFSALKDTDPYVRVCWSFGNNGKNYLYSEKIEDYKRALHEAIIFGDYERGKKYSFDFSSIDGVEGMHNRRIALRTLVFSKMTDAGLLEKRQGHFYFKNGVNWKNIEQLQRLQRLQSLQRLQRLQSLQRLQRLQSLERLERLQSLESLERLQSLERLEITAGDYRDVRIEPDSVVYCDIPYKGTDEYACGDFDHGAFYEWAAAQKELTLISSYEMPAGFKCIAEFNHRQTLCVRGRGDVAERVFIPESQMDLWLPLRYEMGAYEQGELF